MDLLTPKQCAASIGDIPICVFMEGFLSVMWICTFLLNNTPPQGCLTVPISHTYSCVSTTHPKIKPLTSRRLRTDSKIPIFEIHFHPIQLRWNSSTANSPDNARVYRATIAPLDHPVAALTDVSDTPLRSACTAQPRRQA